MSGMSRATQVVVVLLLALPIAVYAAVTLDASDPGPPTPVAPVILPSSEDVGDRDDDRRDRDDRDDGEHDRDDREGVRVVTPQPTNVGEDDDGPDDDTDGDTDDDEGGDD